MRANEVATDYNAGATGVKGFRDARDRQCCKHSTPPCLLPDPRLLLLLQHRRAGRPQSGADELRSMCEQGPQEREEGVMSAQRGACHVIASTIGQQQQIAPGAISLHATACMNMCNAA